MKEAEIHIKHEYDIGNTRSIVNNKTYKLDAKVEKNGSILSVDFNKKLPYGYVRIAYLSKIVVNVVENTVSEVLVDKYKEPNNHDEFPYGTTNEFNLESSSTKSIIGDYPEAYIEYNILTAEANVVDLEGNTIYGRKRLVAPVMSSVEINNSNKTSDGIYKLYWMDISVYNSYSPISAETGDLIVGSDSKIYRCLEPNTEDPVDSDKWKEQTDQDIIGICGIPISDSEASITSVQSTILITRYIRQVCLHKAILAAYSKEGYSRQLAIADAISYYREKAYIELMSGGIYNVLYNVELAIGAFKTLFGNTKEYSYD